MELGPLSDALHDALVGALTNVASYLREAYGQDIPLADLLEAAEGGSPLPSLPQKSGKELISDSAPPGTCAYILQRKCDKGLKGDLCGDSTGPGYLCCTQHTRQLGKRLPPEALTDNSTLRSSPPKIPIPKRFPVKVAPRPTIDVGK